MARWKKVRTPKKPGKPRKPGNKKGWNKDAPLTTQEASFVVHYIECGCNASEAARRAGYKQPGLAGHRLKNRDKIKKALAEAFKNNSMQIEEILYRLTRQARGTAEDFVRVKAQKELNEKGEEVLKEISEISLLKAKKKGSLSNAKEVEIGRYGPKIKLYDAQSAMSLLLRVYGAIQEEGGPNNQAAGVLVAPPTAPTTEAWLEAVRLSQGEPSPPKEGTP